MLPTLSSLARGGAYPTDKSEGYLALYDELFGNLRDRDIRLLELGVKRGGSLLLWQDYFPQGLIAGLDWEPPVLADTHGRLRLFRGSQDDPELLNVIGHEVAPGGFDIIIDDCSHLGAVSEASFNHLFHHHLKPGGIYAIEDWGTGYWPWWPDGATYRSPHHHRLASLTRRLPLRVRWRVERMFGMRRLPSHDAGMVGFVKRLVDECGRPDFERSSPAGSEVASSAFARVVVTPGLAIVVKADR